METKIEEKLAAIAKKCGIEVGMKFAMTVKPDGDPKWWQRTVEVRGFEALTESPTAPHDVRVRVFNVESKMNTRVRPDLLVRQRQNAERNSPSTTSPAAAPSG